MGYYLLFLKGTTKYGVLLIVPIQLSMGYYLLFLKGTTKYGVLLIVPKRYN